MKIILSTIVLTTTVTFSWLTFGSSDTKKIGQAVQTSIEEAAGEGIGAGEGEIKRLDASAMDLSSIDSIGELAGVEDLNLSGNQIEDLAALSKLKNLVVLDLRLPDSIDETMTLTRVASMGRFRMAVVSASENRDAVAKAAIAAGCDCAPEAVAKEDLPFNRFIQRPEEFYDFLLSLLPQKTTEAA